MANYRPMGDTVLVRAVEVKNQTESGLYIPDTASKDKPQQGQVIAVGPGRQLEDGSRGEMYVEVGDEVLFGAYAGIEIRIGTTTYLAIMQDDILLVKDDDANDESNTG